MFVTYDRPGHTVVLADHPLTGMLQRDCGDEKLFLVYFPPTGYYGVGRWVEPSSEERQYLMRPFKEVASIGTSLGKFTRELKAEIRQKLKYDPKAMRLKVLEFTRGQNRTKEEEDGEDRRVRQYLSRVCRVNVAHPLWKPDRVFIGQAGDPNRPSRTRVG